MPVVANPQNDAERVKNLTEFAVKGMNLRQTQKKTTERRIESLAESTVQVLKIVATGRPAVEYTYPGVDVVLNRYTDEVENELIKQLLDWFEAQPWCKPLNEADGLAEAEKVRAEAKRLKETRKSNRKRSVESIQAMSEAFNVSSDAQAAVVLHNGDEKLSVEMVKAMAQQIAEEAARAAIDQAKAAAAEAAKAAVRDAVERARAAKTKSEEDAAAEKARHDQEIARITHQCQQELQREMEEHRRAELAKKQLEARLAEFEAKKVTTDDEKSTLRVKMLEEEVARRAVEVDILRRTMQAVDESNRKRKRSDDETKEPNILASLKEFKKMVGKWNPISMVFPKPKKDS